MVTAGEIQNDVFIVVRAFDPEEGETTPPWREIEQVDGDLHLVYQDVPMEFEEVAPTPTI